MNGDVSILSYHVKHSRPIQDLLDKAQLVANYAVNNKSNKKLLTSKYVKHIGLPSSISNQILRKFGKGTIKQATHVNLIIPNQVTKTTSKIYNSITWNKINSIVTMKPLKMMFRWNPGREFQKINQIEISATRFMISATFKNHIVKQEYHNILGIDLNCGIGRHIVNMANLENNEIISLGKQAPNIRKKYAMKRKKQKIKGNKEKHIMKNFDHKMSHKIVNYALKHKLRIVMENLKGIRKSKTKGNGSKNVNRLVNSWSFYRLQSMVEYKSKELGIPFIKVNAHYTSQQCSYCNVIGIRDKKNFTCTNKNCRSHKIPRNADNNAAFNVGKRALQEGGIVYTTCPETRSAR